MNKSEFLNELEKRIRVLEKNEIKDILAEYSQHIDMRIKSGLCESDAIKDFGSIDELTAEILEAYHVNPEYERETEIIKDIKTEGSVKRMSFKPVVEVFSKLGAGLKKTLIAAINRIKIIFSKIKGLSGKIINSFNMKNKKIECSEEYHIKKTKNIVLKANENKNVYKSEKEHCKGAFKKVEHACLVLLVTLCMLPVAFVGIISIFTAGFSIVLLLQGYPIIGIFILFLGFALSSVAFCGLLISLIAKRKHEEPKIYGIKEVTLGTTDVVIGGEEDK